MNYLLVVSFSLFGLRDGIPKFNGVVVEDAYYNLLLEPSPYKAIEQGDQVADPSATDL